MSGYLCIDLIILLFQALIIPWTGYVLGFSIAWILGIPFKQAKTVAIETGIQNFGVAFLIMYMNLPSPEADFSLLPLIVVAMLTNLPLFCTYFSLKFYNFLTVKFLPVSQEESTVEKNESKSKIEKSETLITNLNC